MQYQVDQLFQAVEELRDRVSALEEEIAELRQTQAQESATGESE